MVFARYHVPDEARPFIVTEGEPAGADYLFFGSLMASEDESIGVDYGAGGVAG